MTYPVLRPGELGDRWLALNRCPLCGAAHHEGLAVTRKHAARLVAAGYQGYDLNTETWVTASGPLPREHRIGGAG